MHPHFARRVGARAVLLGALAATAAAGLSGVAAGAANAAGLRVEQVTARDARTIDVRFSKPLGDELLGMVAANNSNSSYLHQFVRVSGGHAGDPDAALSGAAPLSTAVSGTRNYVVETPRHDTLRLVLGAGTTLVDHRRYELSLDADGDALAGLLFRGADGSSVDGSSTRPVSFRGDDDAPAGVAVDRARALDSREVRVTFAAPLLSGFPVGAYTSTSNIVLTDHASGATFTPSYIEPVPNTDRTEYDLQFSSDLSPRSTYDLALATGALKVATSAGTAAAGTVVTTSGIRGSAKPWGQPEIDSVDVDRSRNELRLHFNHRIAMVKAPSAPAVPSSVDGEATRGYVIVRETANQQVAGAVLTDDDVRALLDLHARVKDDSGRPEPYNDVLGDASDGASRLHDVAGYFPDRRTLAIRFQDGVRLAPISLGSVRLRGEDRLVDVTGETNATAGRTRAFLAPLGSGVHSDGTAAGYNANAPDYLSINQHASTTFRHFAYDMRDPEGYFVRGSDVKDRLADQRLDAITIENKYIKATFTPGYGGRMISLIYKPTGHDLLYDNPVGTPYGNGETPGGSPFYAGWLMVYGGVFPTWIEAEHGKFWFRPWDYRIVQSDDRIDIVMTKVDDQNFSGHPSKFRYGRTDLQATVTYSVSKTSPVVDMHVRLDNPTDQARQYEYWTCTTLAPGEDTNAGSSSMEILSNVRTIRQGQGYDWMRDVDDVREVRGGFAYLRLDKLNKMTNWTRDGIAYGQDLATMPQGNWWGVVNHEDNEGVIRTGDNTKTPGMKLWEWGFNGSFNTSPYSKGNSARPYIELWAGASGEFFTPDTLPAGGSKSWTESFAPSMGMKNVTNATRNGQGLIEFGNGRVDARVWSTLVGQRLTATLTDSATGRAIDTVAFTGDPTRSIELSGAAPAGTIAVLTLKDAAGNVLLTATKSDSE